MREKVRDRGRLEHILEAIESIEEFHAQYTFEDIKKNKLIFYGFIKLVEVIGEAVYMLSTEFRDSHSDVNWRQIERDATCPCSWLLYNRSRKPLGHDRS